MYPVPMPLHLVAVALRVLLHVGLLSRCGQLSLLTPGTVISQIVFGVAIPTAILYIMQLPKGASLNLLRRTSPQACSSKASASTPKHPNSNSSSDPRTTSAAGAPASAHHVQALAYGDASHGAQQASRPLRSRYTSATHSHAPPAVEPTVPPSADSLVSPVEAAAAAAAAAAAVKDVSVQESQLAGQPAPRRHRAMYKPRIKPAMLISVKMHHTPGMDFDQLAPALRQSALQALHKYDCATVLASSPCASSSTRTPGLPPRLEVQSACIPGCVHLLLSVSGASSPDDKQQSLQWAQGLATALYLGVLGSSVGEHLQKVIVQVGASSFTYDEGELQACQAVVEVGAPARLDGGAATDLDWQALEDGWVWTAWLPATGNTTELRLGCSGALLAGKEVRVVVTQGREGAVVLDAQGVQVGADGFARVTAPAPSSPTSWHMYTLDDDSGATTMLHAAPVLALPPTCCTELDALLTDALHGDLDGFDPLHASPLDALPAAADVESTAAALAAFRPMLQALQLMLLGQPPGSCGMSALSADWEETVSGLMDYCAHNALPACAALVGELVAGASVPVQSAQLQPAQPPKAAAPCTTHCQPGPGQAMARRRSHMACWLQRLVRDPVPIHSTLGNPQATAMQAAQPPTDPSAQRCAQVAVLPPATPKAGLVAAVWGFPNPLSEQRYAVYKARNTTHTVDLIATLWCIASMVVSLFFGGTSWLLWLGLDSARLLKYAALLSKHRMRLAPHRDVILCLGRAAVALGMVALLLAGWVEAPQRTGAAHLLECHIVLLSCGILRPAMYQVGLNSALALALVAEAWLCVLLHSKSCGLQSAAACSAVMFGAGLVATVAMEARSRTGFLLQHTQQRSEAMPGKWQAARAAGLKVA